MNIESQNIKDDAEGQDTTASVNSEAKANENELQPSNKISDENYPSSISEDSNSIKSRAKISAFLQHPLTLLFIGAVLSSYLIPSWTRQWQNQQTELSTKVEIVNSVDRSSTQMIMAVQYAVVGAKSQSQSDYDNAYRQWQIDKQIIRSKLQAYFPDSQLVEDWNRFSEQLDEFYRISGSSDVVERKEYLDNWLASRDGLYEQKDELNQKILGTRIYVFR
jgi:hypothetical protein